jgi:protein-arginine kinase activator protein McsA
MSIVQTIKSVVGIENEAQTEKRYRCPECDTEFTSFKTEQRAMCMECANGDVELLERV